MQVVEPQGTSFLALLGRADRLLGLAVVPEVHDPGVPLDLEPGQVGLARLVADRDLIRDRSLEEHRGDPKGLARLLPLVAEGQSALRAAIERFMLQRTKDDDARGVRSQRSAKRCGNRHPSFFVKTIDKAGQKNRHSILGKTES